MPSPSVSFAAIPSGDYDALSPAVEDLFGAMWERSLHCREVAYDPAVHKPKKAHDHDGVNSARVIGHHVPNLVLNSRFERGWTESGSVLGSFEGMRWNGTGYVLRTLLDDDNDPGASGRVWGANGADLALSCYIRKTGTVTTCDMEVKLVNADTGTAYAGQKMTLSASDFTTSWTRVWGPNTSRMKTTASGQKVAVKLHVTSWTGAGQVNVDLLLVKPGHRLTWWQPAYGERYYSGFKRVYGSAPMLDRAMAFTNATRKSFT